MPELPECETIVRDLQDIVGYKIIFNKLFNKVCFKTPFYKLDGECIEKVERYGKYIIIKFSKTALMIHLGMSGRIFIDSSSTKIPDYTHFLIHLENKDQVRFVDHRKFGNVWHMKYDECKHYVESKIGPEPFDITPESFYLKLQKYQDKPIKDVLLNQKIISGVGNIYASEACYEAFLNPFKLVKYIDENKSKHLLYAIRKVLNKAIENRGTTFKDFRTGKGNKGNNQNFLKVYKRKGKNCNVCNSIIKMEKINDRSTFYCEGCQK